MAVAQLVGAAGAAAQDCLNCGPTAPPAQLHDLGKSKTPAKLGEKSEELTLPKSSVAIPGQSAVPFSVTGPLGADTGTVQDLSTLKILQQR